MASSSGVIWTVIAGVKKACYQIAGAKPIWRFRLFSLRNPLPAVAARKRAPVFASSYRAATRGSGYENRVFPGIVKHPQIAILQTETAKTIE